MQKRTTLSIFAILMTALLLFSASALTVPTAIASAGLPDLTVTTRVTFDRAEAAHGDEIRVTFTVKNQGDAASGSFHFRVSLSTRRWGTCHGLGNFPVDSLGAGASRTLSITTNSIPSTVPTPGDYYVTVFVDSFKQVTESNENNNIGSSTPSRLRLLPAPPPDPTIDYPIARWEKALHYTPADQRDITHIIIHVMDGSFEGTISWLQDPRSGVSYHYLVSQEGEIVQMVREKDIAWHAGNREYNRRSIGIAHEDRRNWNSPNWATEQLYQSSAALVRYLAEKYGIPKNRDFIIGHNEVPGVDKACPGPYWDWDYFMSLVKGIPAPTHPPVDVPSTIRVLMPDGTVSVMDMEEYLRGVVPAEMGPEWVMARGLNEKQTLEALNAQAIVARTYTAARILRIMWNPHAGIADVCTSPVCCQVWRSATHSWSDEAITATRNVVMTYNGQIIQAFYFAHCDGRTRIPTEAHPRPWEEDLPYLRSVLCDCNQNFMSGHGVGMCQWGAIALAKQGYCYVAILKHYFTGIEIVGGEPEPAPIVVEQILKIARQVVEVVVKAVVAVIEHIIDWVLELFGEEPKEPTAPALPTIPEERAVTLAEKAVELVRQVVNAPYLGDGETWGGKGWNWNPGTGMWDWEGGRFVEPVEIKEGYYYFHHIGSGEGKIKRGAGLDCSGLIIWAYGKTLGLNWLEAINLIGDGVRAQRRWEDPNLTRDDLKPGDLLFFGGEFAHVAMYVGTFSYDGRTYSVVHASFNRGIIPDRVDNLTNKPNFVGFGRVKVQH